MYRLVDLCPVMVKMVFNNLSFNNHIEREITKRNQIILIFESETERDKFHKEYNELFYKGN